MCQVFGKVPPVPSDYISVKLSMQDGVPAETTEKALLEVERARLEVVDYLVGHNEPNPFRVCNEDDGCSAILGRSKKLIQYRNRFEFGRNQR